MPLTPVKNSQCAAVSNFETTTLAPHSATLQTPSSTLYLSFFLNPGGGIEARVPHQLVGTLTNPLHETTASVDLMDKTALIIWLKITPEDFSFLHLRSDGALIPLSFPPFSRPRNVRMSTKPTAHKTHKGKARSYYLILE